jgi:hypothetical protein
MRGISSPPRDFDPQEHPDDFPDKLQEGQRSDAELTSHYKSRKRTSAAEAVKQSCLYGTAEVVPFVERIPYPLKDRKGQACC